MKKTFQLSILFTAFLITISSLATAQQIKITNPEPQNTNMMLASSNLGLVDENTFKEANTEGLGFNKSANTLYILDGKVIDEKAFINYKIEKVAKMEVIKKRDIIEKDFPKYKQYDVIIKLTSKK